jgi:hypothetical protein
MSIQKRGPPARIDACHLTRPGLAARKDLRRSRARPPRVAPGAERAVLSPGANARSRRQSDAPLALRKLLEPKRLVRLRCSATCAKVGANDQASSVFHYVEDYNERV